jgi:hypothetical protein
VYKKTIGSLNIAGKTYYCDASTSVTDERFPEYKNITRGEILLSGHMVEDVVESATGESGEINNNRKTPRCLVKLYSESNFKLNMPLALTKPTTINEMKKYIEKCT